jgi:hypothetical protein
MGVFVFIPSPRSMKLLAEGFLEKGLELASLTRDILRQPSQSYQRKPGFDRGNGHGLVKFQIAPQVSAEENPAQQIDEDLHQPAGIQYRAKTEQNDRAGHISGGRTTVR